MKLSALQHRLFIGFALLVATFVSGYLWPTGWWGTHFVHFLPQVVAFIIAGSVVLSAMLAIRSKDREKGRTWDVSNHLIPIAAGILVAFLCFLFPLPDDFYGNARTLYPVRAEIVMEPEPDFWSELFSLNISPGQGRGAVNAIANWISHSFQITLKSAFGVIGSLCGGAFVWLWIRTVQKYVCHSGWQLLLGIAGLFSPVLLVFFGHLESYAVVYWLLLAFCVQLVEWISTEKRIHLLALVLTFVAGLKFHAFFLFLAPAVLIAVLRLIPGIKSALKPLQSFRGMFMYLFFPLLLLGLFVYFFVFKGHAMERNMIGSFEDIDRLFLPLNNTTPPEDRYNLLSPFHIWDFFQVILFWSPALLFLVPSLFRPERENGQTTHPATTILALSFLLIVLMLFAINPLWSMPMDWDLFLFPVPVLMVGLVTVLSNQSGPSQFRSRLGLTLNLLTVPAFLVMLNSDANHKRVGSVGMHIHQSYYYHTSTYLLYALQNAESPEEYMRLEDEMLEKLLPNGTKGNDPELYDILIDRGMMALEVEKNPESARDFFLRAYDFQRFKPGHIALVERANQPFFASNAVPLKDAERSQNMIAEAMQLGYTEKKRSEAIVLLQDAMLFDPGNSDIVFQLTQMAFLEGMYDEAELYSDELLRRKYPHELQALRITIQMKLETGKYKACKRLCERLLELNPQDKLIRTVYERIEADDRLDELKFLFQRS